jgi:hypothetical protein
MLKGWYHLLKFKICNKSIALRIVHEIFPWWRPSWRPSSISWIAIIFANLCRWFHIQQTLTNILVYNINCCNDCPGSSFSRSWLSPYHMDSSRWKIFRITFSIHVTCLLNCFIASHELYTHILRCFHNKKHIWPCLLIVMYQLYKVLKGTKHSFHLSCSKIKFHYVICYLTSFLFLLQGKIINPKRYPSSNVLIWLIQPFVPCHLGEE